MSKPREFWITYQPSFNYFEASTEKTEGFDYHVIEKHHADQLAEMLEKALNYTIAVTQIEQDEIELMKLELKNYQEGE